MKFERYMRFHILVFSTTDVSFQYALEVNLRNSAQVAPRTSASANCLFRKFQGHHLSIKVEPPIVALELSQIPCVYLMAV